MKNRKLTSKDKEFFTLIYKAATTNPFSPQRDLIDSEIIGISPGHGKSRRDIVPAAIAELAKALEVLDSKDFATIQDFNKSEQELITHVFLFEIYHKFCLKFDQLIVDQINASDQPIIVPFANQALSMLIKRGFSAELANKYFSMFYQIRRAFYFIDTSLLGQSHSMQKLRIDLWNNIFTHDIRNYENYMWEKMEDFSTLLLGPTGSGKGAAATAIGRSGFIPFDEKKQTFAESFTKTFLPINLSQFAETLLESELFGHAKGAFTGAVVGHKGLFSLCSKYGSIFLDEIGDINLQTQIKLLRVLEEREFSPIGSHEKLEFHGRIIAATNRSIDKLRNEGKFRDDFYYRLCSDTIVIPSLQQRIQENPVELDELIAFVVERITGHKAKELTAMVTDVINKDIGKGYHWPGNVRELAQCIRSVIIKRCYTGDATVGLLDSRTRFLADIDSGNLNAQDVLAAYCAILYQKHGTYEQVARITGLDRRTAKKHIQRF